MSFPNKNQSVQCDVRSCKHHTNDGMCAIPAPVTKANAPAITPGKGCGNAERRGAFLSAFLRQSTVMPVSFFHALRMAFWFCTP